MKKSVAKNYIYNLVFQILTVIFPIVTTPYLARVLGAEQIGVFSYTYSIVTYFVLFSSLGINLYGQREIAYIQDDNEKRSKLFLELLIVRLLTTIFSLIIFLIFCNLTSEYKLFYYIWIIELIAAFFDITWYFQGMEQFKKIIIRNIFVKVLSTICIFLFVKNPSDIYVYILIYSITTLIGNLSIWLYLPKSLNVKFYKINFKKILFHLKALFILFIPQIATKVYTILDKIMIGIMSISKEEVGFYEQSQKIVYLLLTILTSLGTVLMPRISSYFSKNDDLKIKDSIYKSFNFVFMIGLPLMLGIILSARYLIPIYLGDGYTKSILLMQVLSPVILLVGLSNVSGIQLLIPLKRQKQYNYSIILGAIVNFVFNIYFIKHFMSVGAAIATVLAEFIILLVQLYSIKDIINMKKVLKNTKNYLISSIVMFSLCYILINILKFNNLPMLLIIFCFGILTFFSFILLLRDQYFKTILLQFNFLKNIKDKAKNIYN